MNRLLLLLSFFLLLAGCSSLDQASEDRLESARKMAAAQPEEALALLEPVVAKHPKEARAQRLRAIALHALGRNEESAAAWQATIRYGDSLGDRRLIEAHREYAKLCEE